jgi:hypothetical protein
LNDSDTVISTPEFSGGEILAISKTKKCMGMVMIFIIIVFIWTARLHSPSKK